MAFIRRPLLAAANPDAVEAMPGLVRIDSDIVSRARYLSSNIDISITEFLSNILRPEIDRQFRKATMEDLNMFLCEDDAADRISLARDGVHYCEPGNPWPGGPGRAYHPHAREVDDSQESGWPSGDTVVYRCPVCGHSWTVELPQ